MLYRLKWKITVVCLFVGIITRRKRGNSKTHLKKLMLFRLLHYTPSAAAAAAREWWRTMTSDWCMRTCCCRIHALMTLYKDAWWCWHVVQITEHRDEKFVSRGGRRSRRCSNATLLGQAAFCWQLQHSTRYDVHISLSVCDLFYSTFCCILRICAI